MPHSCHVHHGSCQFLSTLISKIEIERKFHPTRPLLHALTRSNAAPPAPLPPSITRSHPAAVHFIRDHLSAAGLWVRWWGVLVCSSSSPSTCTSSWKAKVRVGGDFAASQFVEVEGTAAVECELQRVLSSCVAVDCIDERLGLMYDLTPGGWSCAARMMMTTLY